MAILLTYLRTALSPLIFILQLLWRIFWSGLNEKSIIGLVLNFWINFSPVFIWLLIFKNAGLIPQKIRPPIFVKFAYRTENYLFNIIDHTFINLIFVSALIGGSYLLYLKIYRSIDETLELNEFNSDRNLAKSGSNDVNTSSDTLASRSGQEDENEEEENQSSHFMDLVYFKHRRYIPNNSKLQYIINKRKSIEKSSNPYRPLNSWYLSAPALLALSWFLLNFVYALRVPIKTYKDLIAWFSYVICHFCAPLFTAIWLYVFHAPGSLKLFSIALGVQNICGVMTHLLFPNAPPWFIHLYGEDKEANYDMPGYAAGLTRVDVAMGTHLHSKGFHKSPIVFGALPSLHSAMAVMVFFFLSYYSRWYSVKILGFCFVVLQWWATIYLDHHWRLDLIVGMGYSIIVFTILQRWIKRCDERFMKNRLKGERVGSETMGMRVFKNTCIEFFFDPLSIN
ncbi:uncharacterized protein RJT21DRAFT_130801 [Scheffersomyces amazonensis]|uniref:uncharacterized protein n=1 Tax=Scheffersomyces amazonensis TaxID=1078765 RepID=UPI00315D2ABF